MQKSKNMIAMAVLAAVIALTGIQSAQAQLPAYASGKCFVMRKLYDFAANNAAINDVVEMISVPTNTYVLGVTVTVLTAEGGAGTLDIGDGADVDGWHDGIDANATATELWSALTLVGGTPNTVLGYTSGKLYTDPDTIDVKAIAALDGAKIEVTAVMIPLDRPGEVAGE